MFDVNQYVNDLTITEEDGSLETLNTAKVMIETVLLLTDDAYLSRAWFWGGTSAMENQIRFLGDRILPSLEQRRNKIDPDSGVLGESDLSVSWHSNEDKVHINDELGVDERIADVESQIDNVMTKMKTAGIIYVCSLKAHDSISDDLEQLTFAQIKRSSASKRAAAEKQALKQRTA